MEEFNSNQHCCQEIIEKVSLILDGEVIPKEEQQLIKEIQKCPSCLEKFHIEEAFKEFLTKKINRQKVSLALIQSIKEKIKILVQE